MHSLESSTVLTVLAVDWQWQARNFLVYYVRWGVGDVAYINIPLINNS